MSDGIDWVPLSISIIAVAFAALTWWESRRARQLMQTVFESLPLLLRPRKRASPRKPVPDPEKAAAARAAAEERRRLKLELERQKLEWRRNRDIAKAIGWVIDRLNDNEFDEE